MTRSKKLQPVVELARQETEQAVTKLAQVNRLLHQEQQQLHDLQNYRQEYLLRFRGADPLVMPARKAIELRNFLAQLDQAIALQEQQVKQFLTQATQQQQHWIKARSKQHAMQALLERYQQEETQRQERQEQRLSDEYSAQLWRRRNQ